MKIIQQASRLAAQLFAARGSDLLRYVRRRVRDDTDARDIAQETYLRFIRLAKPDKIGNPEAYLFRIATNLLWEHDLRARGQPLPPDEDHAPAAVPDEVLPFELLASSERAKRLHGVLDTLAANPRTALILHLRDGMTYEQIATHMQISPSMVKKHLSLALQHCRNHLRELDFTE